MNNIGMLINLIRNGGNPQHLAINLLKESGGDNPLVQNAIGMINGNDYQGVERLVRNICESKGISADELMNRVQSEYGFK